MSNPVNPASDVQGTVEAIENEIAYFENALEGLQRSYAILSDLLRFHRERLLEVLPEREEISS